MPLRPPPLGGPRWSPARAGASAGPSWPRWPPGGGTSWRPGATQPGSSRWRQRRPGRARPGFRTFAADLRRRQDHESLIAFVSGASDALALLVNNAGVAEMGGHERVNDDALDAMVSVNLAAPARLVRDLLPLLRASAGACVVNVSSEQVLRPGADNAMYGATKSGLMFLTRSWAAEFAPAAIRVNCVLPGAVDTSMLRRAVPLGDVEVPLGRLVTPEDVASAVIGLVEAEMITGASLLVDGGTSLGWGAA